MTPLALTMRSDERLALQVAGGSDAAFTAIYRRYEATLFGYCRSITRNADDAGDALQNAMLKALLALRREERSAPLRPWLFRIVHNEAVNQVTRRPLVAPPRPDNAHASVAGADEQAAARERVAEIVSDLRELPLRQRAALVMRELGDLDYPEIALALDVTENNARQLVFSARASLKDRQEGRGLACDAVRDMILDADARRLRRRPVRAHVRTCEGCKAFAAADPRKPIARAAGLAPWAPLEWLLRALGGSGSVVGGAVAATGGGVVVKAAATAAVLTAGLGVADVAREHSDAHREPATVTAVAPAAEAGTEVAHATAAVERVPARTTAAAAAATPPVTRAAARSTTATSSQQPRREATAAPSADPVADRAPHPHRRDADADGYGSAAPREQAHRDGTRDGRERRRPYEQRSPATFEQGDPHDGGTRETQVSPDRESTPIPEP